MDDGRSGFWIDSCGALYAKGMNDYGQLGIGADKGE